MVENKWRAAPPKLSSAITLLSFGLNSLELSKTIIFNIKPKNKT
jgi:hypothetical protein